MHRTTLEDSRDREDRPSLKTEELAAEAKCIREANRRVIAEFRRSKLKDNLK